MSSRLPVSYWLLPAAEDAAWLDTIVARLAVAHQSPRFAPHVTLHVGAVENESSAVAALTDVAARHAALRLVAGPTGHGPARFRSVFITLPSDPLRVLARALGERAPGEEDYRLDAHLSLVYAELPEPGRAALAAAENHEGRVIRFDTLAAVAPGRGGDFGDVEGWRSLGTASLTNR